jgi:hypothetical protein
MVRMVSNTMHRFATSNPIFHCEPLARVQSRVSVPDDVTVYGGVVCNQETPEHSRNTTLNVTDGDDFLCRHEHSCICGCWQRSELSLQKVKSIKRKAKQFKKKKLKMKKLKIKIKHRQLYDKNISPLHSSSEFL